MAKPPYVPDWVDERTAEWCAELCDAMAARLLAHPAFGGRHLGAEVAATCIRELIKARQLKRARDASRTMPSLAVVPRQPSPLWRVQRREDDF